VKWLPPLSRFHRIQLDEATARDEAELASSCGVRSTMAVEQSTCNEPRMRLTDLLRKHQGDVTTILEIHHMERDPHDVDGELAVRALELKRVRGGKWPRANELAVTQPDHQ